MTADEFVSWAKGKKSKRPERELKYIYFVYAMDSPLVQKKMDFRHRVEAACEMAGLNKEDVPVMDRRLAGFVVEMSKLFYPTEWSLIISNEQTFYEYQQIVMEKITDIGNQRLKGAQLKSKVMSEMDIIDGRLRKYYAMVFHVDKDEIKEVERAVRSDSVNPELIAEALDPRTKNKVDLTHKKMAVDGDFFDLEEDLEEEDGFEL